MKKAITVRGLIWFMTLIVSFALMIITSSAWLMGLIAILVLLPIISLIRTRSVCKQLEIHIRVPQTARKNEKVTSEVTVFSHSLKPLGYIYDKLEITNDLTGEKTKLDLSLYGSKDGMSAPFSIRTAHCGRMTCSTESVTVTDYFGFIPVRFKAHAEGRFTVVPDTFSVDIDPYLLTSPKDGDETRSDRKGSDMTEIFQLREYQPGDNLHGIHWKLSGKLDQLIFREPAQNVSNALLLYWDQSSGDEEQLDALAEAMFSVGQGLCEIGVPFTVGRSIQGTLTTDEIANLDQFTEHFPALLNRQISEPAGEDELSAFGRVFYFTAEAPAFEHKEGIQVFLCSYEALGKEGEIVFSPENAEDKLERIESYEGA